MLLFDRRLRFIFVVLCIHVVAAVSLRAQELGLMLGYHGPLEHYIEAGAGLTHIEGPFSDHGPPLYTAWGFTASVGARIDRDVIVAPQIAMFGTAAIFTVGLALGWFTDFSRGSLRVRPEIGCGGPTVRCTYGYNIPLTNSAMQGINEHEIGISVLILFNGKKR